MSNFKIYVAFNAMVLVALIIIFQLPSVVTALANSVFTVQDGFIISFIATFILSTMLVTLIGD